MVFVLIIAGLIALVAYGFLMWWLFGTVAPEVLVLTSVAGTAIVPAAYGKAAWASFTPHGARRLFVAPVFGLLALIFVDIAYLVLEAVSVVGASVTAPLSEAFGFIALLPWVALDVDTDLSRPTLAAAVLLGTTVKGALLPAFLLLMRGLSNHVRDKKDPAFVQYFFVQARRDLWNVVLSVGRDSVQAFWWAMKWIHRLSWGRRMVVLFPLALTAYLALIPSAIAAIFTAFTLLALHFGGILLLWTLNMYVALLFFTVERAIIAVRSGFAKCPHAGCHKPVPNPIFFCSSCGVPHTRLVPGRCGVFYRVCAGEFGRPGCGARLPTTFLLGKSKLKSACNHCNQPLDGRLFGGSVHVPIYGGPSSGKTMFMMAATW